MPASNSRSRSILNKNQVISIFSCKSKIKCAAELARIFGVNAKTIRDIWKGRTWAAETWHLDETRTIPFEHKRVGRPKGSKDLRPRQRRDSPQAGTTNLPENPEQILMDEPMKKYGINLQINDASKMGLEAEAEFSREDQTNKDHLRVAATPHVQDYLNHEHDSSQPQLQVCDLHEQLGEWENQVDTLATDPFAEDWARVRCYFQNLLQEHSNSRSLIPESDI